MKRGYWLLPWLATAGGCSDYSLNAKDRMEGAGAQVPESAELPPEEDDSDEDTGTDSVDDPETETETEPEPETTEHEVILRLSADDQWAAWMDGAWVDRQEGWNLVNEYTYVLSSGTHVLAVQVDDLHQIINGFIAEVSIDGVVWSLTGEGLWRVTDAEPPSQWTQPDYSDVDWETPVICVDDAPWSGIPTLVNPDAEWVWHNTDCRQALGTGWFRLAFELP